MLSLALSTLPSCTSKCAFYRDVRSPCARRDGGSVCSAAHHPTATTTPLFHSDGVCQATYLGDLAVALVALNGRIEVRSAHGRREPSVEALLASGTPDLGPDELITRIIVPRCPGTSVFVKRRDRASFAFASASAAAWCDSDANGVLRDARMVLGALANAPRRLHDAESALVGSRLDDDTIATAVDCVAEEADGDPARVDWASGVVRQALNELKKQVERA